jgi:hypothetical protein
LLLFPLCRAKLVYADGNTITVGATGAGGLEEFAQQFGDDSEVAFGYARVVTGDEESKRAKFIFLAWTGDNAGIMKKAKMSVHKANVKEVVREFAIETLASSSEDLDPAALKAAVVKAGGANYMGQAH